MKTSIFMALIIALCINQAQAQTETSTTKKGKTATTTEKKSNSKNKSAKSKMKITTDKDKNSYAIGVNLGTNFKAQGIDIDPEVFAQGMKDAIAGGDMAMTDEQIKAAMMALQQQAMAKQQEAQAKMQAESSKLAEEAKKRGAAFMEQNAKQPGVVTLPSGVQYRVITEGTGMKPLASSTVTTHYRGSLLNGKVFDSSYDRGEAVSFPVNGVIAGWTEVLQLMPAGSKWQVWIPSDKAYGDQGAGNDIGPGETLVFDIELLSVK